MNSLSLSSELRFAFLKVSQVILVAAAYNQTIPAVRAAPVLSITSGGSHKGNLLWQVAITPDADLFTPTPQGLGGALAVELGFEVTDGSLVDFVVHEEFWPHEIVGNNPFTQSIGFGINSDPVNNTLFAALGSNILTADAPVPVLTMETFGTFSTTLRWGGETVFGGTQDEYLGSRIAQGNQVFTGLSGSLTLGTDADQDGDVDGADFLLLQQHNPNLIAAWQNNYSVGISALDAIVSTPIPEPSSILLLLLAFGASACCRRTSLTQT